MSGRWIIEGYWSGYYSGQGHVCHRTTTKSQKRADALLFVSGIRFTDGTVLHISVYPAQPREHVEIMHGYDLLLDRCVALGKSGVVPVDEL